MRTAVLVCVGAALAALAAWLAWSATAPPGFDGVDASAPPRDSDAAHSNPDDATAAPRTAAPLVCAWIEAWSEAPEPVLAADPGDPRAVTLRGRLTVRQRPWLHPQGVEIRLTRHWLDTLAPTEVPAGGIAPNSEPTTITAADGTFALRFRPVGGELFFLIDRGGAWVDYQKVPRLPLLPGELDLGDVWLDDRGRVTGQVLDQFGAPVADAVVRAVDETLGALVSGLGDLRAARAADAEHFRVDGTTRFGALPEWVARRDALLPFPTAHTDRNGRFELRGLRPGAHELIVRHALQGVGRWSDVQVAAAGTTEIAALRLASGDFVDLTFVDEANRPWVDASIALVHERSGYGAQARRTDAEGRIRALVHDAAATHVVFTHPTGGPGLDLGPAAQLDSLVVVRPVPELSVALADAAGAPIANGRVRLFTTGMQFRAVDRELPAALQPVERLPGLFVGRGFAGTVAVATAPGHAPAIARFRPDERMLALSLLPLEEVTVRVRDRSGAPIADAEVRVQVHQHELQKFRGAQWDALANDRALVGRTDADGRLQVPVWSTFFSFGASHRDFAPTAGERLVPQAGQTIDLVLYRPAAVVGTLTTRYHAAPAGLRVRVRQQPPNGNVQDASGFLAEHLAVVGDGGRFEVRDLMPGLWRLQPELPTVPGTDGAATMPTAFAAHEVLLDEGQVWHSEFELNRTALTTSQLAGVVRRNGMPLADVLVRVRATKTPTRFVHRRRGGEPAAAPAPTWLQQSTTDWLGDFAFSSLATDTEYELRFDVPVAGRLQHLGRRVVRTPPHADAAATRADLDLECGNLELTCSDGVQPFAGRMLRLQQRTENGEDGACFVLLTDALGRALVDGLPAGPWTLTAVHGGELEPAELVIPARGVALANPVLRL
ncbi:MAG: carboxypeptidase regulatory-like domain-containing protein [Planctomycetes bacterium]|nr:carboxypeptidase regulatory-like domain-containing protein [Planctomycetota bacterium]